MLSASGIDDKIAWYENLDGLGDFGPQEILSTNADSAFRAIASDLDNDGDLDVISASRNDNKLAWYENFTVLGVEENPQDAFKIYPNLTFDVVTLDIPQSQSILSTTIVDISGRMVLHSSGNKKQLNLSNFAAGTYFVQIQTAIKTVIKRIIKQ